MMGDRPIRINERERACLIVLAARSSYDENCLYMRTISAETELDIKQVRRCVRSLARKGLAQYERGLFDEDGRVAGSGYCCTAEGREYLA